MRSKFWVDARSWRNRFEYMHRKERNVKVDHKELGEVGGGWIQLAQDGV